MLTGKKSEKQDTNRHVSGTGPDQSADNKVIDSSHKVTSNQNTQTITWVRHLTYLKQGPVFVWMKKVSDATKNPSAGPGDGWFKISEDGYTDGL